MEISRQRGTETSPQSASKSPHSNTTLPTKFMEIPNQQAESRSPCTDRIYKWASAYVMSLVDKEEYAVDHNRREKIKDDFKKFSDLIHLQKIGAGVEAELHWISEPTEELSSEMEETLDDWWTKKTSCSILQSL
ncbi:hypothetical protein ACMFMF_009379 [Clarireedia jacksonii]